MKATNLEEFWIYKKIKQKWINSDQWMKHSFMEMIPLNTYLVCSLLEDRWTPRVWCHKENPVEDD